MLRAEENKGDTPVEVEDREDRTVGCRVEELVAVPRGGEWACLALPVADHRESDEVRLVKDRPKGVRDRVTELATLVQRSRGLGSRMGDDAAREGELLEEETHARLVLGYVGVDLGVDALHVRLRQHGWGSMSCRSRQVEMSSSWGWG